MLYMKGKREGVVSYDGASNVDWKKTSRPTSWQRFERTLPHLFTPGMFTRISCATLNTVRSSITTPISTHLKAEERLSERETMGQDSDNIKRPIQNGCLWLLQVLMLRWFFTGNLC